MRAAALLPVRGAIAILGVLLLVLLIPSARDAFWGLLFLGDFVAGERTTPFDLLTREPKTTSGELTAGDGVRVPFDFYSPRTAAKPAAVGERLPAFLLAHGAVHEGNRDARVIAMARRLARGGFAVMAPDLLQMKSYRLGFEDADALAACLEYLFDSALVDGGRVGVVAPSFGAGPMLMALARPGLGGQVRFGLLFGAYYDMRRTLRFTLTGSYEAPGLPAVDFEASSRRNRWRLLRGNIDLVPSSPSRGEFAAFVAARADTPSYDDPALRAGFSAEERLMLEFTANTDPARFDSLYPLLPETFRTWVDTFSLRHHTSGVRTKLLLAHSSADKVIPYPESMALAAHLPDAPAADVSILDLFTHVDIKIDGTSLRALVTDVIPGLFRIWGIANALMKQRR
ncbi:MAG: hypothetical protein OXG13_14420 [Gemmatimonadaceae bacterium]|nr:hypothetical protein [Gemmatimonadaceae bacterium]